MTSFLGRIDGLGAGLVSPNVDRASVQDTNDDIDRHDLRPYRATWELRDDQRVEQLSAAQGAHTAIGTTGSAAVTSETHRPTQPLDGAAS